MAATITQHQPAAPELMHQHQHMHQQAAQQHHHHHHHQQQQQRMHLQSHFDQHQQQPAAVQAGQAATSAAIGLPPVSAASASNLSAKDAEKLRAANIALSKTVLTPNVLSPYLPAFIATLSYSIWHGRSFAEMSATPTPGLKHYARFTMDILRATGLSFSVVLLSLKFIYRLKTRRPELKGAEGSECRLLVCALMLAMKYLMDNTYSNKTWHKVSRIPLQEINVTEMEFLDQVNFDLHVEEEDYFEWLAFIEQAVVQFRRITAEVQQQQQQIQAQQMQMQHMHLSHPLARPSSMPPAVPERQHFVNAHGEPVTPSRSVRSAASASSVRVSMASASSFGTASLPSSASCPSAASSASLATPSSPGSVSHHSHSHSYHSHSHHNHINAAHAPYPSPGASPLDEAVSNTAKAHPQSHSHSHSHPPNLHYQPHADRYPSSLSSSKSQLPYVHHAQQQQQQQPTSSR